MPGMTMSPRPSIPTSLEKNPLVRRSRGKTTKRNSEINVARNCSLTFDGEIKVCGNKNHNIGSKNPKDVVNEETTK